MKSANMFLVISASLLIIRAGVVLTTLAGSSASSAMLMCANAPCAKPTSKRMEVALTCNVQDATMICAGVVWVPHLATIRF